MGGCLDGIFDTHAHYDDPAFDDDREALLDRLFADGLAGVVNAASDLDGAQAGLALAARYDRLWVAAGIHPGEAGAAPADALARLRVLLTHPRVVAVGEIGLDYHYDHVSREVQLALFEAQLRLAVECHLPVVVHDREAHADTLRLLSAVRPRGVVHCFSGSVETMREVVALGMYIGLGGVTTFASAKKTADVAAAVPLDRLVLETDAPYLAPAPCRGQRNDSSLLVHTAARIAGLRGMEPAALIAATTANARRLYGMA